MTEKDIQKAADELRIAALRKEHFEKLLVAEGFVIDYSPDKTIVNISKPSVIKL